MEIKKEWFNLNEEERIKQVYTNNTIEDFWNWWSDGKESWMEIRTTDYKIAKDLGQKLKLYYYHGGVFVNNYNDLKKVIGVTRKNNINIWFGVNPRKWNYTKWGNKGLGGTEPFVKSIRFLFLDIDRQVKKQQATNEDLKNCEGAYQQIISVIKKYGWMRNYCKICSGNGIQLLIKLDQEIILPNVEFNMEHKGYDFGEDFLKHKKLITNSIGKQILSFMNKKREGGSYSDKYSVEIDKTGFRIGQVGALPFTKNYKYGGFTWRGILEIKDDVNEGFTDYLLKHYMEMKTYKDDERVRKLFNKHKIVKSRLMENKLIRFMLDNSLPAGARNNYLWFSLKCLFRDSGIKTSDKEFKKVHKLLEAKYGSLPPNVPEKRFSFNPDIVNKYCINNLIPPLYDLWEFKYVNENYNIEDIDWKNLWLVKGKKIELPKETDIMEDMKYCKTLLEHGDLNNINKVYEFTNGCIEKYGEEKTKYYFDYLFRRYIGYK